MTSLQQTVASAPTPARTLRVLHVTDVFQGGISRAVHSMLANSPDGATHHLLYEGSEVPDLRYFDSVERLPRSFATRILAVGRHARQIGADVIYAHSSWAGVFARALPKHVPVIYQPHCYKFEDPTISPLARAWTHLAEKTLAPRSTWTVVLSDHERRLTHRLYGAARTHLLNNVPAIDLNSPIALPEARRAFMIGRICPQKDPAFFAQFARALRSTDRETEFVWIGDGEPEARAKLEAAGVRVTGWLTGEALIAELSRPGLYVHTASYEGFPLSLLDALQSGHVAIARQIEPLRGVPIVQRTSPEDLARVAHEVFVPGSPEGEAVLAGSIALNQSMSDDAQREQLRALYMKVGLERS
ncbi:glycosyltransferase [Microbacterium sp. LMI12-1-1.1]|uniref:glycosyltransferase n=1 Tax=Microbacterium sp. LMI12-1-1.1 TaxID=3135225 RepID=UPI0034144C9B